jgi:Methylase involved in ubiquinone/menaquinone biosynthesis
MNDHRHPLARLLGQAYRGLYASLCGSPPRLFPWHFQWLATRDLLRDLRRILPTLTGRVLDLGCGSQPYRPMLALASHYVGADLEQREGVDVLLTPGAPLPFAETSFDAIICTQVLEHVEDLGQVLAELARVLRPGGQLIVSVPCIFQVHGAPHDYRRFTEFGIAAALRGYNLEQTSRHGGAGSAMAILGLNWIECSLSRGLLGRCCKALALPLWVPFCLCVNLLALGVDALDATGAFAHNLLVVARKPQ